MENVPWYTLPTPDTSGSVTILGLLLLWSSIGKGAQFPLGDWLPRAMEGPTPSSAIFYGAISIHLAPYLLLRSADVIAQSAIVSASVIGIGLLTALHATFVGRVQTDIKSALAYASMTQVGLIFVEIGFGLHLLALVHVIGHAALRSLQILRSPSLLHDHHHLEQSMGHALARTGGHLERWVPHRLQPWLYRAALERGYLDDILSDWVVTPLLRGAAALDSVERRWGRFLSGEAAEVAPDDFDSRLEEPS
jgi:NADH:ubiquinone oxidoreductase subunit 5 (subunit L)/multisubunit Na+/H+ antiporter MnhA subunit